MESLSYSGIETVLFVRPPTSALLDRYRHARAIGIAGGSRAMSPEEMDAELPTAFQTLLAHQPPIVHYKTCSTFDSSPTVGSIGRAIEIGQRVVESHRCPLVVGAPVLQRFCVFGNLFARSGLDSEPYRLDRHPTMMHHPVTPMHEADLRVHLSRQTNLPISLVDVLALDRSDYGPDNSPGDHPGIVLFDTLRDEHLPKIGRSIVAMQQLDGKPLFVAGSSGVNYALAAAWRELGVIESEFTWTGRGKRVDQTLVVSGSCSPVTDRQIAWALNHGFVEVELETAKLDSVDRENEINRTVAEAAAALADHRSVVVHSCRGPQDPRIASASVNANALGDCLATIMGRLLAMHTLHRVAVTGGDTSGHIARRLEIDALEMVGPMAPGSPLCVARSATDDTVDGIEITFKGGQVGHDNFFGTVLNGQPLSGE